MLFGCSFSDIVYHIVVLNLIMTHMFVYPHYFLDSYSFFTQPSVNVHEPPIPHIFGMYGTHQTQRIARDLPATVHRRWRVVMYQRPRWGSGEIIIGGFQSMGVPPNHPRHGWPWFSIETTMVTTGDPPFRKLPVFFLGNITFQDISGRPRFFGVQAMGILKLVACNRETNAEQAQWYHNLGKHPC